VRFSRASSPDCGSGSIIVSATKGIEIESGKRISQVVATSVNEKFRRPGLFVLSGPSFASEVVENHPTAIVAASNDPTAARPRSSLN